MNDHAVTTLLRAARDIESIANKEGEPRPSPRKHAVTVVWCEGDRPATALVITTGPDRSDSEWEEILYAHSVLEIARPSLKSKPDDAAKWKAGCVRLAADKVYRTSSMGGGWIGDGTGNLFKTKAEVVSVICERFCCPIDPAEVEAILRGGDGA